MTYRALQNTALALLAGSTVAISGAAFAGNDAMHSSSEQEASSQTSSKADTHMSASLTVEDQKVTDDTVVIKDFTIPNDGFLVIHAADDNGKIKAPESIGHKKVDKGEHHEVAVELNQSVATGDKLFAMLHNDTGHHGEFEFSDSGGKTDGATKADGKPVIKPFMIK